MTAPRSYVIGLPVVVTVHDDGTVTYDIDTSEASDAPRGYDPDYMDMQDEAGNPIELTDEILEADRERIERAILAPWVRTPGSDTIHAVAVCTVPAGLDAERVALSFEGVLTGFDGANVAVYASPQALIARDRTAILTTTEPSRVAVTFGVPPGTYLPVIAEEIDTHFAGDPAATVYPSISALHLDLQRVLTSVI